MTDEIDLTGARAALNAFCAHNRTVQTPESDLPDIITGLLHLADVLLGPGGGWEAVDTAVLHYEEEKEENQ